MNHETILIGRNYGYPKNNELLDKVLQRIDEPYTLCIEYPDIYTERFKNEDWEPIRKELEQQGAHATEEFFSLIKKYSNANRIRCIDLSNIPDDVEDIQNYREHVMAKNIEDVEGKVVALVGALHACKDIVNFSDFDFSDQDVEKDSIPTGEEIKPVAYRLDEAYSIIVGNNHYDLPYDEHIKQV